ncbi:MAG TPA: hypothetical protein VMO20_09750 [Candidatus Acidoferrum sp.]|nr:hypothetical protein [Candidatus Acidoferrum sp.]
MKRHSPIAGAAAASSAAVAESPPPPKAESKPQGLKKVSFGNITKKTESAKTAYPVMPDTRDSALLAARILKRTEEFEALKGALETDKAELKMLAAPHYFTVNHGRHEVPSSVAVNAKDEDGKVIGEVLVTFQNRYSMLPDEAGVEPILGERTGEFFRQSFELKIKGDKLPEDKTQELMDELQALFTKYNATDAIEVKEGVKPTKEFHDARHLELSVEQNLQLEQACPIIAMVKTKGRK